MALFTRFPWVNHPRRILIWCKSCATNLTAHSVTKQKGLVNTVSFSLSRHFRWKGSVNCFSKLKHGLVLSLLPTTAYLMCNWTNVRSVCCQFRSLPSWIQVHCQGTSLVIKPSEQQYQLTVKSSVIKLMHDVHRSLLLLVQCVKLCVRFGPLLVLYPFSLLSARLYSVWLKALFHMVQQSGPIYIKLGQWAATRRDLFSVEFCILFSQLHYCVQPHEWRYTEQALVTAYGKRWYEVLKIDKSQQPLGSGCVAQVCCLKCVMLDIILLPSYPYLWN